MNGRHSWAIMFSLAVGIAGATAAFSVVSRTPVLSGLFDSESRVWFMVENRQLGLRTLPRGETFENWAETLDCCRPIEAFRVEEGAVRTDLGARPVAIAFVTEGIFDLVGVAPAAGRVFDRADLGGKTSVALVSEALARSLLGGARRAVGETVTVDSRPLTVVGVLPSAFAERMSPGERLDVVRPLDLDPREKVRVFGRLREGVAFDQAQAELEVWADRQRKETQEEVHWVLLRPEDTLGTTTFRMLEIALLSGLLLVLVTGSNVAHLLAAESEAQKGEVAIRWAMGADRIALLRWKAAQVLVVTLAAGLLAAGLAGLGLRLTTALLPENLRFLEAAKVDMKSLAFAVLSSFVVILFAGALPLLGRTARHLKEDLSGRQVGTPRGSSLRQAMGQAHIVTMIAVSLALAVACGLVAATALYLRQVDLGFEPEGLEAIEITLPEAKYRTQEERKTYFVGLMDRIRGLPAVNRIAIASPGPLGIGIYFGNIRFGDGSGDASNASGVGSASVWPGYFRTVRQSILAGREFVAADLAESSEAIVISETTSKRLGPIPGDAIGRFIRFDDDQRRVVGVVADVRSPGTPQPFGAEKVYWPMRGYGSSMMLLTRADNEILPIARQLAASRDPDVIVEGSSMGDRLSRSLAGTRFLTTLFSLLTLLAFALALLGVYGVLSNFVVQQRGQLALRMALGASPGDLRQWVFARGVTRCILGAVVGILASYPLTRMLATQLQGVEAENWVARLAATLLVLAATLVATWLPASRTFRIEPSEILKEQ